MYFDVLMLNNYARRHNNIVKSRCVIKWTSKANI